jgi:tetratricopeptide (TPR) repeat protein
MALLLAGCALAADQGWVDSRLCAGCHSEIAASYARTGMGRSFFRPGSANAVEDYVRTPDYYHALSGTRFRMTVRDGQYFQRCWQLDSSGREINVEELRIDYVMGSGNHARSYLHRTERGMLIELPLGWYPDHGGEWAMVPGNDVPRPQTRRFVSYKCMFCHNSYPQIPAANRAPGADPVFLGELPQGIDCQRCHGPGGEHVRTSGRVPVVNPATLSPVRRMEICMQCHLETTSGRIPAVLQRFERAPFSYIPGEPLADFALSFDHAPGTGHDDKFEAVSSVYRLRQSRCFLASGGKLECATCHDPHRIPRGEEAIPQYSAACLRCHADVAHTAAVSAADCITCHMPKRRVDDAPHVVMTDHKIQRRVPANALAEFPERPPEDYRGEVVPYYPAPLPDTPRNSLYRAVAQVGLGNHVAAGLPELARLIRDLQPREPEFYVVLGDGWKFLGNLSEAAAAYRRALGLEPGMVRAMRALAAVDPPHAEELLARAVRVAPDDPESWFRYGVLTASAERIQKAIALDPWLPDQSRRLAEITHSQSALADALRTDPFDDAAWDLGGRILAEKGDLAGAIVDFDRAIELHPSGPYLYDYALTLVRAGRLEEARQKAETALHADPSLVAAHELLGGIHTTRQEWFEAAREYTAALRLQPDLPRLHLRLGVALAALGDKSAAAVHFRAAAAGGDPAIARQAEQALRDLGAR